MMSTEFEVRLHWSDYLVFGLMLAVSLGIGIYQALSGGKQKTTGEYLIGNRAMGLVPVTMSLVVSYISTITLIGYPAEMFAFGVQYYLFTLGIFLGILGATFVFVPLFYPLKITSVNEYLFLRYESRVVQYIGTFSSLIGGIFFLGQVFYGPAVSIQAVSGFPTLASVLIIGCVSILYTSIGGFKAVIWTDVFQCFIMFAGMIAVLVQAIITVGGFTNMWNLNKEWGRLNFFDFDPDPTKRMNFWGAVFGNAFTVVAVYGYAQSGVQRFCSMPTLNKAKWCLIGMVPGNIVMQTLAFLCGLAMFAYYADIGCDPKHLGFLSSYNQLMPYFVATIFSFPVIPGLFIAAIYAASLSTASTVINGCAAVAWRDVLQYLFPNSTESKATWINRIVTVVAGLLGVACAVGISEMKGGTLVQISSTFGAGTGGPVFALFLFGAFFPWVTWQGALVASVFGAAFGMWISLGSYLYGAAWQPLPSPSANCSSLYNISMPTATPVTSPYDWSYDVTTVAGVAAETGPTGINRLYSLSFLWMREATAGVTLVIAILVSAITGFRKADTVEEQFVHPIIRKCIELKPNQYDPDFASIEMTSRNPKGYIPADIVRMSSTED